MVMEYQGYYQSAMVTHQIAGIQDPYPSSSLTEIHFAYYCVVEEGTIVECPVNGSKVLLKGQKGSVKCREDGISISMLQLLHSVLSKVSNHYKDGKSNYVKWYDKYVKLHKYRKICCKLHVAIL